MKTLLFLIISISGYSQTYLALDAFYKPTQLTIFGGYKRGVLQSEAGLRTHFQQPLTEVYITAGLIAGNDLWVSSNAGIAYQLNQVKQDRHIENGVTTYNWKGATHDALLLPTFTARIGYRFVYASASVTGKGAWYGVGVRYVFKREEE